MIPKSGRNAPTLRAYVTALEDALKLGTDVLAEGGSAMKAVEVTVRFLEDHPFFNAGRVRDEQDIIAYSSDYPSE